MRVYINGSTSEEMENLLVDALWFMEEEADECDLEVEENNMCLCGADAEGYVYKSDAGKTCFSTRWRKVYMFYGENGRLNKVDDPSPEFIKEFLERRGMTLKNIELSSDNISFKLKIDDLIFDSGETNEENDFIYNTSELEEWEICW